MFKKYNICEYKICKHSDDFWEFGFYGRHFNFRRGLVTIILETEISTANENDIAINATMDNY